MHFKTLAAFTAAISLTVAALWTGLSAAEDNAPQPMNSAVADGLDFAVFAGGCFWCVESDFDKVEGVVETVSGFSGGRTVDPTYEDVTFGDTGHKEVVKITFDPAVVTYRELADYFFRHVDPTDEGGQFCDRGESYKTWIFARDDAQMEAAEAAKAAAETELGLPVVTPVEAFTAFYPAEAKHQDYYKKNPVRYRAYRFSCGRDRRVSQLWGDQ